MICEVVGSRVSTVRYTPAARQRGAASAQSGQDQPGRRSKRPAGPRGVRGRGRVPARVPVSNGNITTDVALRSALRRVAFSR